MSTAGVQVWGNFAVPLAQEREIFHFSPTDIYSASGVSCASFRSQSPRILPALSLLLKFPKQQRQDLEIVTPLWIAAGRQRAWLPSPLQGRKLGMLSLSCNMNETASLASCTQGRNWVQRDEQKWEREEGEAHPSSFCLGSSLQLITADVESVFFNGELSTELHLQGSFTIHKTKSQTYALRLSQRNSLMRHFLTVC